MGRRRGEVRTASYHHRMSASALVSTAWALGLLEPEMAGVQGHHGGTDRDGAGWAA